MKVFLSVTRLQQIFHNIREKASHCSPEIQTLMHQEQGIKHSTSILIQWSNHRTELMHQEFTSGNLSPCTPTSVREMVTDDFFLDTEGLKLLYSTAI